MRRELDIEALFREHGAFVCRCLERLVSPGPHVDDLMQETFLRAFRSRHTFDPSLCLVTTWLYGILNNVARRHLRTTRRRFLFHGRFKMLAAAPHAVGPDGHVERGQAVRLVGDALARLPLKQREVFALYELEGMDGPAIAELVGVPVGTVWTRLHHARRSVSKVLKQKLGDEVSS